MKSKFTWILTLCLAFFIQFSFAQEKTVSGTVTSKTDKMTMPGVNVVVQGTTRGVQTDFDGKYSIKVAVGQKLVFSFLGSKNQTVTVGSSNTINVQLEDDTTQLTEVVVEGYGITRTKKTSNVASVTVSSKTLEGRPNANFVQSLQSQVAGLQISTGSGQPGANSTVILRGVGSLTGKVEPLYVIDGVPMSSDNFRSLNPDEIESVSVLKDAGATSIYGSRAASGVIVVKTKKGGFDSALKVRYVAQTGFSTMQNNKYHLMNSNQLLRLEREKEVGQGGGIDLKDGPTGAPMTDDEINKLASEKNTDWRKVFFRTGVSQNHVLSFQQGSKNVASFTSIGYFQQDGILKGTDLTRFSLRSNVDGKSNNGKFNYSTNLSLNFSKNNSASSLGTGAINQNFVIGAYKSVPYISPNEYTDGAGVFELYKKTGTLIYTPLMLLDKLKLFKYSSDEVKAIANMSASYKLAKDWTISSNLGIDYTQIFGRTYEAPESFNAVIFEDQNLYKGFETQTSSRDVTFNWNNSLHYGKTFAEKHNLDVSLFTEYFKAHLFTMGFNQNGLDPKTDSAGHGTGYLPTQPRYAEGTDLYIPEINALYSNAGLFSYFAVGDYDYDGRFGFGATIRRDASSRFAQTNRWGTFYSLTGRWNLDREKFMENSGFNMLKLRGSYGTNGNQDISNGTYNSLNDSRELYTISPGYQGAPAYVVSQLAKPDLKWETSVQGNVGLDFETLKNRFRGNIDVYNKTTKDLYQALPVSLVNGVGSVLTNFGDMYNRGIEVLLQYDVFKNANGFNLTLKANGSYNKNRLTSIPSVKTITEDGKQINVVDNTLTINAEGHRLSEFYLIRYAGVNPANGNLLFLDKDGNATENPDPTNDRVFTGKSSIPAYQGGFGFDADYKGFFLNTQFSWVADIYRFDYDLAGYQEITDIGVFNKSTDLQRAWTVNNRNTDIPSLFATNSALDANSDRYLRNAAYLRLKFASFGYNVPKKMLGKGPFTMVKAFVNAENMLTWSKWRGMDAESSRGADQNQYPTPKVLSLGLNLEF